METIAASSSVLEARLFGQHQAVLTILQGILDDPNLGEYHWLDLACGKGQIISQAEKNLSVTARAKILYFGYDVDNESLKVAEKKARRCIFAQSKPNLEPYRALATSIPATGSLTLSHALILFMRLTQEQWRGWFLIRSSACLLMGVYLYMIWRLYQKKNWSLVR